MRTHCARPESDYDAALARFMGKQAIYEKYLRKLPEDAHMDAAWAALEQQDEAELLEQVHAIKGLTGTLGITGLFEQSAAIVALLRAGTREGLQEKNDVSINGTGSGTASVRQSDRRNPPADCRLGKRF